VPEGIILDLSDGEQIPFRSNDQDWLVSWHPSGAPPVGIAHGSVGICFPAPDEIVLVSRDGLHWDLPAGRPEALESWEDTLRREVLEEASARVLGAMLLGYSRGECRRGPQKGLVLIRSFWRAEVALDPWRPNPEIQDRRSVPIGEALAELAKEGDRLPLPVYRRALAAAGGR
jgi:ADP-ribose pyrophosphatase YjhB (NUDIX family)